MRIVRWEAGLAMLMLSAAVLAAQQPARPQPPNRPGMMGGPGMQQHMRMMDSLNARLDSLVSRMNRASGNQKVTAMADVINELVAQRKAMQQQMRQMMESPHRMMRGMAEPPPGERPAPPPPPDSAAADTGHAAHHPPA
jgi:Spy/CpxP family protein refolding chaperone